MSSVCPWGCPSFSSIHLKKMKGGGQSMRWIIKGSINISANEDFPSPSLIYAKKLMLDILVYTSKTPSPLGLFLVYSFSPVRLREAACPGRCVILCQSMLYTRVELAFSSWILKTRTSSCKRVFLRVFGCRVSSHASSREILSGWLIVNGRNHTNGVMTAEEWRSPWMAA